MKILKKASIITYVIAILIIIATVLMNYNNKNVDYFGVANANGYLSFTFLSLALVVSPIIKIWPKFALNSSLFLARRAIGVSAFGFAAIHYFLQLAFTFGFDINKLNQANELGGFGITPGFIPLIILFILTCTSTDLVQRTMGKWWYKLHMLTYLAYVLVFAHAVKIGVDFKQINAFSGTFFAIALITLVLVVVRIWKEKTTKKLLKVNKS